MTMHRSGASFDESISRAKLNIVLTRNFAMIDPKVLDDLSSKMSALLAATPARDIEKNAKAMLGSMLGRLDIVTRDEFDVQTQVLARTREKLTALEARVDALEKKLAGQ
jgi:hypothetical protein